MTNFHFSRLAAIIFVLLLPAAAYADTFTYTPTNTNDSWSSGANWSATPVSDVDTTLVFGPAGNFTNTSSLTNSSFNSIASSFALNVLTLRGTGGAGFSPSVSITIGGGSLRFVDSSEAAGPQINLDAMNGAGGSRVTYSINSGLSLVNSLSVTGNGTAAFEMRSTISGSGGITKSGSSKISLSGSSSYTGGTTITGGIVSFHSAASLGTGNVTLNGGTLQWATFNTADISPRLNALGTDGATFDTSSNNVTLATPITGSGPLIKAGSGTLALVAANTYTGGTTITSGRVNFTTAASFGSGNITLNGGELQWATGNTVDISPRLNAIGPGGTTFDTNGNNITFATVIAGSGPVIKTGAGTLTLTAANTYTGGITITGGLVNFATAANFGTGNITLYGGALQWAAGNTVDISPRLDALGFDATFDTNGNNVTLATAITGAGPVIKAGAGTLTLTAANTYNEGTQLNTGTIAVGSNTALGTGTVALNGGVLQSSGGNPTLANAVSLNTDTTISGSNAFTLGGAFTLNGFKSLTVTNTAQTTISGAIGESSLSILIKQGSGELQLTGANTYTGGTLIGAGTVRINNLTGSAFGTGAVTVASGAILAGEGSFTGALQLNGTYSPGNSPGIANTGAQIWAGGGGYVWELNNASDDPDDKGITYDWMNIGGALNITATTGSKFTIYVTSLTAGNAAGATPGFVYGTTYHWVIASATSITNFSADKFAIDTSAFYNEVNTTGFTVTKVDNDIVLTYTAVPEPSTYAIGIAGLLGAVILFRRRRAGV
jgi:autotransporter-associated beta strand protein